MIMKELVSMHQEIACDRHDMLVNGRLKPVQVIFERLKNLQMGEELGEKGHFRLR